MLECILVHFNYKILSFQLGTLGLPLVAILTAHSCLTLVEIKKILIIQLCCSIQQKCENTKNVTKIRETLEDHMTYIDIGHIVFGTWMSWLLKILILVTQLAFCVNFHIVIGNTLRDLFVENRTGFNIFTSSNASLIILVLSPQPLFMSFVLIRKLRNLGLLSTISGVSTVTVFVLVVGYIASSEYQFLFM